jgi:hypothetical protein
MLHCDNAPVHNTEEIQEGLSKFGFIRMVHQPESPDLVPCDFFLFGAMKQTFAGKHSDASEDLLCLWRGFWEGFLRTS